MGKPKVLIKASGDLLGYKELLDLIREKMREGMEVVVLVGGGTDITAALRKVNPTYEPIFTPIGRRLDSPKQERVRRQELQNNRQRMLRLLDEAGIEATVEIPYVQVGRQEVPVNADMLAALSVHSFDRVVICTLPERIEKKTKELETILDGFLDKVEIVALQTTPTPTPPNPTRALYSRVPTR